MLDFWTTCCGLLSLPNAPGRHPQSVLAVLKRLPHLSSCLWASAEPQADSDWLKHAEVGLGRQKPCCSARSQSKVMSRALQAMITSVSRPGLGLRSGPPQFTVGQLMQRTHRIQSWRPLNMVGGK